ncbi:MAG: hypothetical protein ACJ79S_20895 [Gemmatimonadaceae bacterium]
MATVSASISLAHRAPAPAARALAAGAVVGALDGTFAVLVCFAVNRACTIERVFQSIASGLLGRSAYTGGPSTAALGAALHFFIATAWATAYAVAYSRSAALRRMSATYSGTVGIGAALGAVVWSVMRFVVVPLSQARQGTLLSWVTVVMIVGHMIVVGLPIAAIVRGSTRTEA